jgi:hypothetical protein
LGCLAAERYFTRIMAPVQEKLSQICDCL